MSQIRLILGSKLPSPLSPWPLWSHFNQILKTGTRQQSTVMKLEPVVAMALISSFALSFLWFVVEYGQKGRCHGQLDE
jgi:hypothetical protein